MAASFGQSADVICILLVGNDESDVHFFRNVLDDCPDGRFELHACNTLSEAEDRAGRVGGDVILLDSDLVEPRGFDGVERLAQRVADVPILVLTGVDDHPLGIRAIRKGAQDYLLRSAISPRNIGRIVKYAIERKHAQRRLLVHLENGQEGMDRFRGIVEESPEAIVVVDAKGTILYGNPAAQRCLDRRRAELEGAPCPFRLAPDQSCDHRLLLGNDERIVEVQSVGAEWEGRAVQVASLRDVTDLRRQQRQRESRTPSAQRAQAAESLACLVGGIAHDYRNILMGILGNASLALSELDEDDDVRFYVGSIRDAARRASDLTNKMLTYSGQNQFRLTTVSVTEIIEELRPVVEPSAPPNVAIHYEIPPETPPVCADADHLRQAITNVVVNAWESLDEKGGDVAIRTGAVSVSEVRNLTFEYFSREPSSETLAWIEIKDTGGGIPEDLRHRVFDPFYSTKFAGRGLGLSTVQGIVRGHHGGISLRQDPSGGTVVTLFLPSADSAEGQGEAAPGRRGDEQVSAEAERAACVLAVDDETVVLDVCRRYLSAHGYEVLTASEGEKAVATFRERCEDIDAVILDLNMPNMGGREILQQLKEIRPSVRVIISTGFAASDVHSNFEGVEIAALLEKPYEPSLLLSTLRRVLGED